jgi:hypothetical protein
VVLHWTDVVEAIASGATVLVTLVGFLLVVHQIRLVKRSLQSDTNGRFCEQSLTIMAFMAERPYLYDYFYERKELVENDDNRIEVLCATEMMANYADLVVCNLSDVDRPVRERWHSFVADALANSPVLRGFIVERRRWYSDGLVELSFKEAAVGAAVRRSACILPATAPPQLSEGKEARNPAR